MKELWQQKVDIKVLAELIKNTKSIMAGMCDSAILVAITGN